MRMIPPQLKLHNISSLKRPTTPDIVKLDAWIWYSNSKCINWISFSVCYTVTEINGMSILSKDTFE